MTLLCLVSLPSGRTEVGSGLSLPAHLFPFATGDSEVQRPGPHPRKEAGDPLRTEKGGGRGEGSRGEHCVRWDKNVEGKCFKGQGGEGMRWRL